MTSPMVRVRRVTRARAAGDGLYCSWAIACSTRARVAGRTFGMSLMTRETVWCETPARRATSKMFAARPRAAAPLTSSSLVDASSGRATMAVRESTVSSSDGTVSTIRPSCTIATRLPTRRTSSSSAEMNMTERPLSASSPIRFCTSTFAPTSMPRVGSSSTSARGERASSRASSTFCWLPPDRVPAGRSDVRWPDVERVDPAERELALSRRPDPAQDAALGLQGEGDVLLHAQLAR